MPFLSKWKTSLPFLLNEKQISVRKTMRKWLTSYYIYTCKILIGKFQNLEKNTIWDMIYYKAHMGFA